MNQTAHTLDDYYVIYIFGNSSTALEIADAARACCPALKVIFVASNNEETLGDNQIRDDELHKHAKHLNKRAGYIISMANAAIRLYCQKMAEDAGLEAINVIHPQSWVSRSATIGKGCYLAAGCRVSSNALIGGHCILNFNTVFGHDSTAGAHFIANPSAIISGNVTVGERTLLGANAFILQGMMIGNDCQVDAMTYVGRDLENNSFCTSRQLKIFPRRN